MRLDRKMKEDYRRFFDVLHDWVVERSVGIWDDGGLFPTEWTSDNFSEQRRFERHKFGEGSFSLSEARGGCTYSKRPPRKPELFIG